MEADAAALLAELEMLSHQLGDDDLVSLAVRARARMGMILECHALAPHGGIGSAGVLPGVLLGSVSVNSVAVEALLGPLAEGPLAGLDFAANGPAGVRFHPDDLPALIAALPASGVEPNIANTIADAAQEALSRRSWLWIGFA